MPENAPLVSRRNALKTLAAASGALALSTLPSKWGRPLVEVGALPAHAQTSALVTVTLSNPAAGMRPRGLASPALQIAVDLAVALVVYPASMAGPGCWLKAGSGINFGTWHTGDSLPASFTISGLAAGTYLLYLECSGSGTYPALHYLVVGVGSKQEGTTFAALADGYTPPLASIVAPAMTVGSISPC